MKNKSILLFVLLVAIIASFNFISCQKDEPESDDYSEWMEMTEADSVIYAKARTAYLEDPANADSKYFMTMQFLSHNPYAVRTKAVGNGMNYQFAYTDEYVVTVYKGTDDEIGNVIEIEIVAIRVVAGNDQGGPRRPVPVPLPPRPPKRDTIPY